MSYINISGPIFRDLISAKAKLNDIEELVRDPSFRPNAKEWREYLYQIISSDKYKEEYAKYTD
jgi:hypothetical protein